MINYDQLKEVTRTGNIRKIKRGHDEIMEIRVGDLILEYWASQRKLIPFWETHWYQLDDNIPIYLSLDLAKKIVSEAKRKAGSRYRLKKDLELIGRKVSRKTIYRLYKGRGVSIGALKAILSYLDIRYDSVSKHIEAIGSKKVIKNPSLPFNLNTPAGFRLIARMESDGWIETIKYGKFRFSYSSTEYQAINDFEADIKRIFGDVSVRLERVRNCVKSTISSKAIVHILTKLELPVGEKAVKNAELPSLIKYGDKQLQREYIRQVFKDEGVIRKEAIRCFRSVDITNCLIPKQRTDLKNLEWKKRPSTYGKPIEYLSMSDLRKAGSKELVETIKEHPPRLLHGEMELLKESFSINAEIEPKEIYKTRRGYSVCWILNISKAVEIAKFKERIWS